MPHSRLAGLAMLGTAFLLAAGGCPADGALGSDQPGIAGNLAINDPDEFARRFPGCDEPATADEWRARVLELVNEQRIAFGIAPVRYSEPLERQATQYACELIEFDFFDHVNPVTGSTLADRADEFGYDFLVIGENLAGGQPTPERAVEDWMNSPGHRQNILDARFTELGVAVRTGGDFGIYWVQEFGRPVASGFGSPGGFALLDDVQEAGEP